MSVVRVAFVWHMHQPLYTDPLSGKVVLPWVRLHALKDYVGMIEVLSETPEVHATFNLVPSLLDQIEAYATGRADEPLLQLSLKPPETMSDEDRILALSAFFMAHEQNLVRRFPRFGELLDWRGRGQLDDAALRDAMSRFSVQDLRDLQLLSKLAWFDLEWQENDPVVSALCAKGRNYSEEDKRRLADRERALLGEVIPAYRRAAESGQVEISTTPYYHPILPLLCDTEAHLEACPGAPLPRRFRHPEDAADQIRRAMARHAELFGAPPVGMWPSEGSLSEAAVLEMARAGIRWTASDESVLERSLNRPLHRDSRGTAYPLDVLYRPWVRKTTAGDIALVFRDRAMSDLIGFSYSGLEPERAAQDLLDRLRRVGEAWTRQGFTGDPLVPIILDGENAWEYFRDGGRQFLRTVYRGIASDPGLLGVTVSEALAANTPSELMRVFAGSWIHANFSVWIGHADDRRAWTLLADARDAIEAAADRVSQPLLAQAWESYRAACGSDWCWWYGEEHKSEQDVEFDRLFRRHLAAIYAALGLTTPETLAKTLITTRKLELRQSHPTGAVTPTLDGRVSTPGEWIAAGVFRGGTHGVAMQRGGDEIHTIRFGVGNDSLHLLLESTTAPMDLLRRACLHVQFPGPTTWRYRVCAAEGQVTLTREERREVGWVKSPTRAGVCVDEIVEMSIPINELRPSPDGELAFRVIVRQGKVETERQPEVAPITFDVAQVTRD